jgi:hypothetical protein
MEIMPVYVEMLYPIDNFREKKDGTVKGLTQRWASFPPEVTVKSLPLPTNLKIVTVTSLSLPV